MSMSEGDLKAMGEKKLDPMQAFMGGKLKVKGNMMLLMKLQDIMNAANWVIEFYLIFFFKSNW